jgi:hypothetical protein
MSLLKVYFKGSHDANRVMYIPEIITNPRSYGTGPGHVDNHTFYGYKAGEGTGLQAKILICCTQFFNVLEKGAVRNKDLCFLMEDGIIELLLRVMSR